MDAETTKPNFVRSVLPWAVAAGMLLVYLVTLSHWVTLSSLPLLGQVAGWDWPKNMLGPVPFLVTYPLRWLPVNWLPLALNLLAAVGGALTLALLARSVALLPHDRTKIQRRRERNELALLSVRSAWLPPVLAALVCGLQLTFWENAMAGTGELLNLLLFAYSLRALLEFRLDRRQSWLTRAAVFFGVAMVDNWLIVALLPFFLVALLWIQGLDFFNPRFLIRMALAGLAGFALCLLMPWIRSHSPGAPAGFWQILHVNLQAEKTLLVRMPLKSLWVLGLVSLLPLALMSIRWKSFDRSNQWGEWIAALVFHIVHAAFLIGGLWIMLDPPFSPRIFPRRMATGISWLQLYYLIALSVGYYSGYFLLICGAKGKRSHRESSLVTLLNWGVRGVVWLLAMGVPAGLIYKNLPQIQAKTQPTLSLLANQLTENLPARDIVVLSDEAWLLALTEAALARSGNGHAHIMLNTAEFAAPAYHRFLVAKYPLLREDDLGTNSVPVINDSRRLVFLLGQLAHRYDLYYLHPAFGYLLEYVYLEPHGLVYQMKPYPADALFMPPALSPELVAENRAFWKNWEAAAAPLVERLSHEPPVNSAWGKRFFQKAHLEREPDQQAQLLGYYYSRALDWWGTELQKTGQLEPASWSFQRAQDLNPDNVIAKINAGYNQGLRAGKTTPAPLAQAAANQLAQLQNGAKALAAYGPFDEPLFSYEQGAGFYRNGFYRQAAQQFTRVRQLAPENQKADFSLAQIYILWRLPDKALEILHAMRPSFDPAADPQTNLTDRVCLEATAYFVKKDAPTAERILQSALAAHPDDKRLLNSCLQLYFTFQVHSNGLALIERMLQQQPDDPTLLINKGYACIQLKQFAAAIPPLDRVLILEPTNHLARLNHAIACLCNHQLDDARRDYEILQKAMPLAYQVYYGLGEIAYQKKDRPAAINYYQCYLTNAPANTEESALINARLAELKSNPP